MNAADSRLAAYAQKACDCTPDRVYDFCRRWINPSTGTAPVGHERRNHDRED
jgi:hypothetical protein